MSYRPYLSEHTWNKIPKIDYRQRFFIETYIEKLGLRTPHFYQSRLMNLFTCCMEVLTYIDEYRTNNKNIGNLISSLDEIDSCLMQDQVAKSIFPNIDDQRKNVFKVIRGGTFSGAQLNQLSVMCRAFLTHEKEYEEKLLVSLREVVFSTNVDITNMRRVTANIYSLTNIYVTHLLNKGYSPTYLFNRADQFTRVNNYGDRDAEAQFVYITDRLKSHVVSYDVYFAIRAHKPACLLGIVDDKQFSFFSKVPTSIQDKKLIALWGNWNEGGANVIAKSTISTTDYVSASWRTKDGLDKLLDAVTALELNPKISVHSHCLAVSQNQKLTHEKVINIDLLIGFLTSESGTYFSTSPTSIRDSLAKLNEEGQEHLGRSLRYLRLSREAVSLEQKLLNLWIAIESLFADGESSILSNIIEYVPQLYAATGLLRRVHHLRELLVRSDVAFTPLVKGIIPACTEFDKSITVSHIFHLLRNEDAVKELFESLAPKEHLKFKLLNTFEELKDNNSLAKRIKSTETDVQRQLRRIYFLRNKIAHTGHYENIRPQLITHLLDYLAICYMAIATSAKISSNCDSYSIADLLGAYKLGVGVVLNRLEKQQPVNSFEELIPIPLI